MRKLLLAVALFSYLSAHADNGDTFTAQTVEGVTVTYQIINEDNKTCQVGYTYVKKLGIRRAIDQSTSGAVTIPSTVNGYTVKFIGDYAFNQCSNLTSIFIPEGVTYIGKSAFNSCSNAETISIPNTVSSLSESGDRLFASCKKLKTINIPEGITSLGPLIFYDCESLESVTLPSTLISLGTQTFSGCVKLTSIILPNQLKSIGYSAFSRCSFTSLTLPGSFTGITDAGTGIGTISTLKEVTICEGVSTLYYVFRNCMNIEKVICYNQAPVNAYGCWTILPNAKLYVPKGCKAAYEADENWNNYFTEILEIVNTTDVTTLDNVIYLDEEEAVIGSQKTISIKMKNTAAIRGFQFNMTLPEGVTPATYSNGKIICSLSDARRLEGDQHTISVSQQADGSYLFLCNSIANETFTGSDGEVLTLKINIADNMAAGDYPITLSSIKLSETNINNSYETAEVVSKLTISDYELGDINGDDVVDVSDYIGVANHILGNTPAGFNVLAADVNGDQVVDISDYIGVANIILTGSIYGKSGASSRPFVESEEPMHEPQ